MLKLTIHVLAEAAAPLAADALHGVLVLLTQGLVAAHQVQAGDDHLVHDGRAFLHAAVGAAAEQT